MKDGKMITINELKQCADTLVRNLRGGKTIYVGDKQPRAVIVSASTYETIVDYVEHLEDRVAYLEYKATDPKNHVPFDPCKRGRQRRV